MERIKRPRIFGWRMGRACWRIEVRKGKMENSSVIVFLSLINWILVV